MFQISSAERCALYDLVTFEGPPKMEQVLWPAHCVQESWGAQLHQDLKVHPKGKVIHKGINPEVDSYSAFFGEDTGTVDRRAVVIVLSRQRQAG